MSITISFVTADRRPIALQLLFARFPVEEQESRLTETLRSAERGGLNLENLLLAEENGRPVGAALTMHQSDGVALVWPPVISCQAVNGNDVEDLLMKRLCEEIDRAGSKLAQVLLTTVDVAERELLERHRFERVAEMFFIARILTANDPAETQNDAELDHETLDHETFNESNRDRFASVIERTYQKSLDCPFLEGFRNGTDALISHRLSGCFDPAKWRLYRIGVKDIGVLLMNDHPDQNAIELVYFGIVPEFRGRGLGRQVLVEGIQAASQTGRAVLFLAVDCGNVYANALYNEMGFAELARRQVMVRRFSRMARD